MQGIRVPSLGWEDPLEEMVLLPGKSHGQRSLAGCSPWGRERVRHNLATKQQQECDYAVCHVPCAKTDTLKFPQPFL